MGPVIEVPSDGPVKIVYSETNLDHDLVDMKVRVAR